MRFEVDSIASWLESRDPVAVAIKEIESGEIYFSARERLDSLVPVGVDMKVNDSRLEIELRPIPGVEDLPVCHGREIAHRCDGLRAEIQSSRP